ncbi:MAG: class I SAM-dependent methyltransferase [Synergistales bacterium]
MGKNYYADSLNSANLFQVYETGIERVRRYLDEEIEFVRKNLHGRERILELGAGYGRIMKKLAPHAGSIVGIDISEDSIAFGKEYLKNTPNCSLLTMDGHRIEFSDEFDVVICLQNGLSAMKGNPLNLVRRSMAALTPGGKAYFSSYSRRFWEVRLAWFLEQASRGLLGEIDMEKTGDGKIVCRDGFTATTFSASDLAELGEKIGCAYHIEEVDESSLFLVLEKD